MEGSLDQRSDAVGDDEKEGKQRLEVDQIINPDTTAEVKSRIAIVMFVKSGIFHSRFQARR
jgi:hypothetical protein